MGSGHPGCAGTPPKSYKKSLPKTTKNGFSTSSRAAAVASSKPAVELSCGAGEAASSGRAGLDAVGFDVRPVGSTADLLLVLVDGRADQAAHRTVHQFHRIPPPRRLIPPHGFAMFRPRS